MVTGSTEFPKADGDIFYGADANKLIGILPGMEQLLLSVVGSGSTASSFALKKQFVLLHNRGTNRCYVNFDAVATVLSYPLDPGERLPLYGVTQQIQAICDTGLTTSLSVLGLGDTTQGVGINVYNLSCTSANASVSVAAGTQSVIVKNFGTKGVYFNLDAAATLNNFIIFPNDLINLGKKDLATVQGITAGTDTSSLRVIATIRW